MSNRSSFLRELVFFVLLFAVSLFLTLLIHSKRERFTWQSELWGDKAGYYIYLPATFFYHFDLKNFPEKIEERTGGGFILDTLKGKLDNRYTCGVSILVSPFFIATHFLSKIAGIPEEQGFSLLYYRMTDVAAIVYLILGLWILKKFLDRHFKQRITYLAVLLLLAGTNLFYYGLDETLMSHVYSFFLFALFLYSMQNYFLQKRFKWFLIMAFAFSLAVLIRPTAMVLLILPFFWRINHEWGLGERIKQLLKGRNILAFLIIATLVFLPQMIYWKYLTGSLLHYSYGSEGFTGWKSPYLTGFLFSPLNGLFVYSPIILIMLTGIFLMIRNRIPNGILLAILFAAICYLFASWFTWYFACSLGQRSFVEYYALFSLPLGVALDGIFRIRNLFLKTIPILILVFFSYFNIRFSLNYEKCFFGSSWDWDYYCRMLEKEGLYWRFDRKYRFLNDFENSALAFPDVITDSVRHSGRYSAAITKEKESGCRFLETVDNLGEETPAFADAEIWILKKSSGPLGALLVCSIEKNGAIQYRREIPIDPSVPGTSKWYDVKTCFAIPAGTDRGAALKIFLLNKNHADFFADDMKISFRTVEE